MVLLSCVVNGCRHLFFCLCFSFQILFMWSFYRFSVEGLLWSKLSGLWMIGCEWVICKHLISILFLSPWKQRQTGKLLEPGVSSLCKIVLQAHSQFITYWHPVTDPLSSHFNKFLLIFPLVLISNMMKLKHRQKFNLKNQWQVKLNQSISNIQSQGNSECFTNR